MGNYAITENGYDSRLCYQHRWLVWNTKYGWVEGSFGSLAAALIFVAALNGYLIGEEIS